MLRLEQNESGLIVRVDTNLDNCVHHIPGVRVLGRDTSTSTVLSTFRGTGVTELTITAPAGIRCGDLLELHLTDHLIYGDGSLRTAYSEHTTNHDNRGRWWTFDPDSAAY